PPARATLECCSCFSAWCAPGQIVPIWLGRVLMRGATGAPFADRDVDEVLGPPTSDIANRSL
ncbi:MAG TPA: hypothetical protein VIH06_12410, partial [Ilumatobacteraceae bacterium]